jgi:glycerol-3-phosphate dehydrogenase
MTTQGPQDPESHPLGDDRLNPQQRAQALARLRGTTAQTPLDLLVVGGGVVGAGAALDAAARGLTTGLVEATGFAAGTSSRSSRLAHGGLRYLEQREFSLVHEALTERGLLLDRLAPHLVHPVPMIFPVVGKAWEKPYAGVGVTLYDALSRIGAYGGSMPRPRLLSNTVVKGLAPSLDTTGWKGAVQFYDAQINDARHTVAVLRSAVARGAAVADGVRVTGLLKDASGERIIGASVATDDGEHFDIYARIVLSATGVWTDSFLAMCGQSGKSRVKQAKGVHLIVRGGAIRSTSAVIARTPYSVLFILPWGNRWIIGTTDTPHQGDLAEPGVAAEDVDYLIEQTNRWLAEPISADDIISTYAGLRPLVAAEVASDQDEATTQLSREHVVFEPAPGAVVVTGGKYTTYRVMAADAVDAATTALAMEQMDGLAIPESTTDAIPLVGAEGYHDLWTGRRKLARSAGLSEAAVAHLLRRHGDRIGDVLDLIEADPSLGQPLDPTSLHVRAEVIVAVTHEGARSLSDILLRRLRIGLELPDGASAVLDDVAALAAPHLGWDAADVSRITTEYREWIRAGHSWKEGEHGHDGS